MATKICYQCRSEVDILAKVCPQCRAKLGDLGKGGVAKKPVSFVMGCLAVFFGLVVIGSIGGALSGNKSVQSSVATTDEPVDPKYGKKPDISAMTYALRARLRAGLHDPSSLDGPELTYPIKDTVTVNGKKVDCWKVGVQFRAKNGFGALRLHQGAVWMKNDESIKEVLN